MTCRIIWSVQIYTLQRIDTRHLFTLCMVLFHNEKLWNTTVTGYPLTGKWQCKPQLDIIAINTETCINKVIISQQIVLLILLCPGRRGDVMLGNRMHVHARINAWSKTSTLGAGVMSHPPLRLYIRTIASVFCVRHERSAVKHHETSGKLYHSIPYVRLAQSYIEHVRLLWSWVRIPYP